MMIWFEGHNLFVTLAYGISFVTIATLCAVIAARARNMRLQAERLDAMMRAAEAASRSEADGP